jgi:hypothetical protein
MSHYPKRFLTAALLIGLCAAYAEAQGDKKVEEGKLAPDITLPAVNVGKALPDKAKAKTLSLKDVKGKNVVLFFFPKAMTRG